MARWLLLLIPLAFCGFCGCGAWNCIGRDLLLEWPDGAPERATTLVPGPRTARIFLRPNGSLLRFTLDSRLAVGGRSQKVGSLRDMTYANERAATLDENGRIVVYAVPSLRPLVRLSVGRPKDEYSPPFDVALSPDGSMVATADGEANVRRWNAATGRPLGVERLDAWRVESISFDQGGTLFAFGGAGAEGQAVLEWPPKGEAVRTTVASATLEIGPAGQRYWVGPSHASGRDWKMDLPYPGGTGIASPDGRYLALALGNNWIAGSMSHTYVVDAATGRDLTQMRHPAWRMDAQAWWRGRLVLGGIKGYLGLFDPSTGRRERALIGHTAEVIKIVPDGDRLFTLDDAGDVRVIDWLTASQ